MHVMGAIEFAFPPPAAVSLLADTIDVWFFPHWSAHRQAAESEPLRGLLARYLKVAPERVRIARDAYGKPHLADGALDFNLSHCDGAALIAIGAGLSLGVDLERPRRERPVIELAQRFFTPEEATSLERLEPARRQAAFLDIWTCKEAVLKAMGRGLAHGLDRVVFALDANGAVRELAGIAGERAAGWQVIRLQPAADSFAAVAWQGSARTVRLFRTAPPVE